MQNGQLRTSCCCRVIHQFWEQFVVNIDIAGFVSSTSPAQERSDELAPREWCGSPSKTQSIFCLKKDDNRDADDPLAVLPEWLEEFTDNLEDTELHAPAHISQDSDSEHPTKVVENQGSTVFILTSQKKPKLRSLLAN